MPISAEDFKYGLPIPEHTATALSMSKAGLEFINFDIRHRINIRSYIYWRCASRNQQLKNIFFAASLS
jgi:hypothetical protein